MKALYLVTRNLRAADVLDPTISATIDFPESVVGLLKGDLGFPHRGFPPAVENAILKGTPRRDQRAGLTLQPVDFDANIAALTADWCGEGCFEGERISAEQAMSSLMYPKVFSDYMKRRRAKGRALRYLPTPIYFHAMRPGQRFTFTVPSSILADITKSSSTQGFEIESSITIELLRVCPLKNGKRTVVFTVNNEEQHHDVKDTSGVFVFSGEMANGQNPQHVQYFLYYVFVELILDRLLRLCLVWLRRFW